MDVRRDLERTAMTTGPDAGSSRSKLPIVAGVVAAGLGVVLLFKESIYSPRHGLTMEFGEYHWMIGLVLIAGGIATALARSKGGKSQ